MALAIDYSAWRDSHQHWNSLEALLSAANWQERLHNVDFGGVPLDFAFVSAHKLRKEGQRKAPPVLFSARSWRAQAGRVLSFRAWVLPMLRNFPRYAWLILHLRWTRILASARNSLGEKRSSSATVRAVPDGKCGPSRDCGASHWYNGRLPLLADINPRHVMSTMNVRWISAAFMAAFLVACQGEQPADTQGTAGAPSAAPEKPAANRSAVVLADGYVPSFRHKLRSQRHVAEGSKFRHVVIMEFLGTDPASVIGTIRSELTDRGFDVDEPVKENRRTRMVAAKSSLRLITDVYGADTIKVNDPAARGIAYFTWIDSNRR